VALGYISTYNSQLDVPIHNFSMVISHERRFNIRSGQLTNLGLIVPFINGLAELYLLE